MNHSITTPQATPANKLKRKRIDDKDHPKAKLIALLKQAITNTEEEIDNILDQIKDLEHIDFHEEDDNYKNSWMSQGDFAILDYIEVYNDNDDMSTITNIDSQSLLLYTSN